MANPYTTPNFSPTTFPVAIPHKLSGGNFLPWKQIAISTLRAHNLENHLLSSHTPQRFTVVDSQPTTTESQEFKNWKQQDNHIVSWLLSSMDALFLNRMVGCDTTHQIWSRIEEFFASQTMAKARQLKLALRSIKKQGSSASDYVLQIKNIADSLAAVGSPLTINEHIDTILDGLNERYESFITSVLYRREPYTIGELEAHLMTQEALIDRLHRDDDTLPQANYAQTTNPNFRGGRTTGGKRGMRGGHATRDGRSSWNQQRIQCQICGRVGHPAVRCYYRFDQQYQGNSSTSNPNILPPPPSSEFHQAQAFIATASSVTDPTWHADTGASHHMTNDPSNFLQCEETVNPDQVTLGNGSGMPIAQSGNRAETSPWAS